MSLVKVKIPPKTKAQPHFKGLNTVYEGIVGKTKYMVLCSKIENYIHIRVHRDDDKPICDFMDMQEIKDLVIGKDKVAIQVFPKTKDMIDNGNTYHLWHWPDMNVPNLNELYDYGE